jgi:hypothetical protein
MKILINHLTRMKAPNVCVAGLDAKGWHVRPIRRVGHLDIDLIREKSFHVGTEIDLGPLRPCGKSPHVEDRSFSVAKIGEAKPLTSSEFWDRIDVVARGSLIEIFGDELAPHGAGSCVLPQGKGKASLGVLRVRPGEANLLVQKQQVRMALHFRNDLLNLGVTDLRMYDDTLTNPNYELFKYVSAQLNSGVPALLSVGVGRPWATSNDNEWYHYLQVNNVHLSIDPLLQNVS